MELFIWIAVFVASLALLVKSSDWLLDSSEKIGLAAGMSPFLIGVTIIAAGTSVPELVSSLFAVWDGVSEVVIANAVGSNIANILLIIGVSVLIGKMLKVSKDLIDLDLPLLALGTTIFFMVAWDGSVNIIESIILILTYVVYTIFSFLYKEGSDMVEPIERPRLSVVDFLWLFLGIIGLAIGANYLIDSVVALSAMLKIGAGVIAITAVAVGTSLPELLVSAKAALKKKPEVALGNVFGSNIFNVLIVVGVPGLFGTLYVDSQTFTVGFPVLIITTLLFIISGISRRIHLQEGVLYLVIYLLFIAKLFNLF